MFSNLKIQLLTDRQKDKILDTTYALLEDTGVHVFHEEAVKLLVAHGCTADGVHVKIPKSLVKKCIELAPTGVQVYNRKGEEAMLLKGNNIYFGSGPTCCYFYDPYTGERRKPMKQDAANTAKLSDALPNLDYTMSLSVVSDHTPTLADIHELDAMLRNTTKPVCTWAFNAENLEKMIDMCAAVAGSHEKLSEKPFVIIYNEPTTPLTHTKEALDKMFVTSKYRIPSIYSPGLIMGATAPVTIAGALAVGIADCLVGLVVSQLLSPGTPFIGGSSGCEFDMRTMQPPYGAPNTSLLLSGANELLHYLGIPSFDYAGATDSKVVDAQAGIESTLQVLFSLMSSGNLVHDAGFMDMGMTGSLTHLCVCNEIIGIAKRCCQGIEVNDETLAYEAIKEVGPGGNFLQSEHTVEFFRDELYFPTLIERRDFEAWEQDGSLTMEQRAVKNVQQILESHAPEELSADVLAKLDAIVNGCEAAAKA